jgi:DNA helicase-2/ATP-dependent DNA helicase PcrA
MTELRAKAQQVDLVELLDFLIQRTGYKEYILSQPDGEERWENIQELRSVAQEYSSKGLEAFLEGVSLVSDVDNLDEKAEGVTLITLHQAKGLEFGAVFIVGMEEGVFPHYKSFGDPEGMEEERRLCYVGITRAKKHLYLVYALRRTLGGISAPNPPSRFLRDIPSHLTITSSPWEGEPQVKVVPFKVGDQVRHTVFGEGIVVSANSLRGDQELTIAFKGAGVKKLILSLSPLQRIE